VYGGHEKANEGASTLEMRRSLAYVSDRQRGSERDKTIASQEVRQHDEAYPCFRARSPPFSSIAEQIRQIGRPRQIVKEKIRDGRADGDREQNV
jgi:hypothetical protein